MFVLVQSGIQPCRKAAWSVYTGSKWPYSKAGRDITKRLDTIMAHNFRHYLLKRNHGVAERSLHPAYLFTSAHLAKHHVIVRLLVSESGRGTCWQSNKHFSQAFWCRKDIVNCNFACLAVIFLQRHCSSTTHQMGVFPINKRYKSIQM